MRARLVRSNFSVENEPLNHVALARPDGSVAFITLMGNAGCVMPLMPHSTEFHIVIDHAHDLLTDLSPYTPL